MKRQTTVIISLFGIIVIALGLISYRAMKNKSTNPNTVKTYINTQLGYQFQYPGSATLSGSDGQDNEVDVTQNPNQVDVLLPHQSIANFSVGYVSVHNLNDKNDYPVLSDQYLQSDLGKTLRIHSI
jgi:hypothetical protein